MIILALDCRNINPSNTVWHALEDDRICWWANSKEDHESGACYLCGSGTILPLYHITGVGPTIKHQRWTANSFSSNGFRIFLQRSQQQLNFTMIAWGFGELGLQELMSWHKYVCMYVSDHGRLFMTQGSPPRVVAVVSLSNEEGFEYWRRSH